MTVRTCIFCGGALPTSLQAKEARFCSTNHRNAFTSGARRLALELLDFGMITAEQIRKAAAGEPAVGDAAVSDAVAAYLAIGALHRVRIGAVQAYVKTATGTDIPKAVLAHYICGRGFRPAGGRNGGAAYVRIDGEGSGQ